MTTRWEPSPRRRRRNLLLLAGLVPSLVATAVACALLLMLARQAAGEAAARHDDHEAARESFAANRWFGTVEQWIAAYNEGVASFRAGEYDDALVDFLAALRQAPADRECLVLHNIAVTRERLGDVAAITGETRALSLYRAGREALAAGRCLERQTGPEDLAEDRGGGPADLVASSLVVDEGLLAKITDLIAEREREELARLTPEERARAETVDAQDRAAERREQRMQDNQQAPVEPSEDYGW